MRDPNEASPQGAQDSTGEGGSHDGAVRAGSGGSPPRKNEKHDDGLNDLPDRVREAVKAYLKNDASCEKGVWSRAEKAHAVKAECDAEREAAIKAGKSEWTTLHKVAKSLGESKGSFYDDLDAWQARMVSGLTSNALPPKGYSAFVGLGRLLKSAKKLVLVKSEPDKPLTDEDVERAVSPVTEKVKEAANHFALNLGKHAIKNLLKNKARDLLGYPPENRPDPSDPEMALDNRDGVPITGDDLAKEIADRCERPDYAGRGSVTLVTVGLNEMGAQQVASALGCPTLHEKIAATVRHGMDLWVCFRQKPEPQDDRGEAAQEAGGGR